MKVRAMRVRALAGQVRRARFTSAFNRFISGTKEAVSQALQQIAETTRFIDQVLASTKESS